METSSTGLGARFWRGFLIGWPLASSSLGALAILLCFDRVLRRVGFSGLAEAFYGRGMGGFLRGGTRPSTMDWAVSLPNWLLKPWPLGASPLFALARPEVGEPIWFP